MDDYLSWCTDKKDSANWRYQKRRHLNWWTTALPGDVRSFTREHVLAALEGQRYFRSIEGNSVAMQSLNRDAATVGFGTSVPQAPGHATRDWARPPAPTLQPHREGPAPTPQAARIEADKSVPRGIGPSVGRAQNRGHPRYTLGNARLAAGHGRGQIFRCGFVGSLIMHRLESDT